MNCRLMSRKSFSQVDACASEQFAVICNSNQEEESKRLTVEKSKEQNGSKRSGSTGRYRCSLSRSDIHAFGFGGFGLTVKEST